MVTQEAQFGAQALHLIEQIEHGFEPNQLTRSSRALPWAWNCRPSIQRRAPSRLELLTKSRRPERKPYLGHRNKGKFNDNLENFLIRLGIIARNGDTDTRLANSRKTCSTKTSA